MMLARVFRHRIVSALMLGTAAVVSLPALRIIRGDRAMRHAALAMATGHSQSHWSGDKQ